MPRHMRDRVLSQLDRIQTRTNQNGESPIEIVRRMAQHEQMGEVFSLMPRVQAMLGLSPVSSSEKARVTPTTVKRLISTGYPTTVSTNTSNRLIDPATVLTGSSATATTERGYYHTDSVHLFLGDRALVVRDYAVGEPFDGGQNLGVVEGTNPLHFAHGHVADPTHIGAMRVHTGSVPYGLIKAASLAGNPIGAPMLDSEWTSFSEMIMIGGPSTSAFQTQKLMMQNQGSDFTTDNKDFLTLAVYYSGLKVEFNSTVEKANFFEAWQTRPVNIESIFPQTIRELARLYPNIARGLVHMFATQEIGAVLPPIPNPDGMNYGPYFAIQTATLTDAGSACYGTEAAYTSPLKPLSHSASQVAYVINAARLYQAVAFIESSLYEQHVYAGSPGSYGAQLIGSGGLDRPMTLDPIYQPDSGVSNTMTGYSMPTLLRSELEALHTPAWLCGRVPNRLTLKGRACRSGSTVSSKVATSGIAVDCGTVSGIEQFGKFISRHAGMNLPLNWSGLLAHINSTRAVNA